MKTKNTGRAILGLGLCVLGVALVVSMPSRVKHTYRVDAGGCRLVTDIVEPAGEEPKGYVVLLHGLAATKRIMSYMAEGLASQGLRVFVPDLPGHGRTDEPFSFNRAEQCSENLLRELAQRKLLDPERTILAGHSMGGAIALRVASHEPVAGVIAVSPAPVQLVRGIPPEVLPYHDFGKLPEHSLVIVGGWEPGLISDSARELLSASGDATSKYEVISHSSHVSNLFSSQATLDEESWADSVLHIDSRPVLPSHRGVIGLFVGLIGLVTLVGPFLRETLRTKEEQEAAASSLVFASRKRMFLDFTSASLAAVAVLRFVEPLRFLRLFNGDYFASALLIVGVVVLMLHIGSLRGLLAAVNVEHAEPEQRPRYIAILLGAFGGAVLYLLFAAWFELSFTETWPTAGRLARFIPLFLALLPHHLAEELLLGPAKGKKEFTRLLTALGLRLVTALVLFGAVFVLHSGQILPSLLAPFFALFCLGQRWGMDVVRKVTESPSAAAIFGAILLAGFCLVAFPTT
jgi:pimeloyl-ACP methyl ester carboxylesterase